MREKGSFFVVLMSTLWACHCAQNSSVSGKLESITFRRIQFPATTEEAFAIARGNSSVNGEQGSSLFTKEYEHHLSVNSSTTGTKGLNALPDNSTAINHKSDSARKNTPATEQTSNLPYSKWLSSIFAEAKGTFNMQVKSNKNCKRDYEIYEQHLRNQTIWAVRMMESSEWPEIGLLSGSPVQMGDYYECLKSEAPRFRGKYCFVGASLRLKFGETLSGSSVSSHTPKWVYWPNENSSAWRVISQYESEELRISRLQFLWAICIPSSCNAGDLQQSVFKALTPILRANGIRGTVYSFNKSCQVREASHYPRSYHIARSILVILIFLLVLGTLFDVFSLDSKSTDGNEDSAQTQWSFELLKCFSVLRNCEALTQNSENTFAILYILKLFLLYAVVRGHAILLYGIYPMFNTEQLEMKYNPQYPDLIIGVVVNGFFLISGFLNAYFGIATAREIGPIYVLLSLVFRWLRIVPAYGLILLVYTCILPYLGDGPFWTYHIQQDITVNCVSKWWTNLLMVNNIVIPVKEQCMRHSWYITVDYHLSIVGSVLSFVYGNNKKAGILLMSLLFLGSDIATFLRIYQTNIYGTSLNILSVKQNNPYWEHDYKIYRSTYFRSSPFLLGFATALVTKKLKEKEYKFSLVQKVFLLVPSFVFAVGAEYYSLVFYKVNRPYYRIENAVYGVVHRLSAMMPFACLICISLVSGLGVPNKFAKFKLYLPLGRLVYCIYLVSYVLQEYHVLSSKKPMPPLSNMDGNWIIGGDILYSTMFGFFLFLLAEGPGNGIVTLLRQYLIKNIKRMRETDPECPTEMQVARIE